MLGKEIKLLQFLDGHDKRCVIPVYQRNYDWKKKQCEQLFNDLLDVANNNRPSHFFGSIVSKHEDAAGVTNMLIIDGQQRLTTISLLLLAMCNLIKQEILKSQKGTGLARKLYESYLVDEYQPEDKRMKLKPVKNDWEAFQKLFTSTEDPIKDSNLTINYQYFINALKTMRISVDQLYDAIYRLEIIDIQLSDKDDPQRVFESLNSTGLDLSEGDKIRNYILMGLEAKEQERCFNTYWNPIEEYTSYNVSAFIRDYLSSQLGNIPNEKKVYEEFKSYFVDKMNDSTRDGANNADELLTELRDYAKRYAILLHGFDNHDKCRQQINACLVRLNKLETSVIRPFFLEALRLLEEGTLTISQVADMFFFTESYLFRRNICNIATSTRNKIFCGLHRAIMKYDGTSDNYVEKFKYNLLNRGGNDIFPNDLDFARCFVDLPMYREKGSNSKVVYILERLNNAGTEECIDVYDRLSKTLSIEHIMPQTLTSAWKKSLGDEYERIHQTWVHRIANLTLTAYNSEYSNKPFLEKRDIKNGFRDSGLRINSQIREKTQWTEDELQERNNELAQRALNIWPLPTTTFLPEPQTRDTYDLQNVDLESMKGRKPTRFKFRNHEQSVTGSGWTDMLVKVLKLIYEEDRATLAELASATDGYYCLHNSASDCRSPKEIGSGVFVDVNSDTPRKLTLLKDVFEAFGMAPEDLVFYLSPKDNTTDD